MTANILAKIKHVSIQANEVFKSDFGVKTYAHDSQVKNASGEGYVFSFKGSDKLYLMTNAFILRDVAYDGPYFSYNFDYISLDSAVSGKRGVKVKKAVMSYSSMNEPSRERVDSQDIVIIGKIKMSYMPEKTKVIEKEGWKIT